MTDDLQKTFERHKLGLIELSRRLEQYANDEKLTAALPRIRKNLSKEQFRLVVLGQFKRGKSTFINALLGERILPTDVIPVTAVITEIGYSRETSARVFFHEGESKSVSIQDLDAYISESRNPQNEKRVAKVEVGFPAAILEKGLIIVDTPGVGSIHEHNTRLTQEYLQQADAAVFIFSADPPLTELEKGFLTTLLPVIPHLIFVLNKSDYLQEHELAKVIEFNKENLRELLKEETAILPLSALQGIRAKLNNEKKKLEKSGLSKFERELNDFLLNSRGRYFIISNAERMLRVGREWLNLIELDRKARTLSIDELDDNLAQFNSYMEKVRKNSERLRFLLDEIKQRLLRNYDEQTQTFIRERESIIRQKIDQIINENRNLNKHRLLPHINNSLLNVVIDEFEPYRLRIEKMIKEQYRQEIQYLNGEVMQIIDDIYRFSAELFRISQTLQLHQEAWQYQSQFYYQTWEAKGALERLQGVFTALLPKPVFIIVMKRKVHKAIFQKLDQQWGRFRSDLFYGLNDNNRGFIYEFNQILDRTGDEISQLIQKHLAMKQKGEHELKANLLEQERQISEVNRILNEIQEIKNYWEKEAAKS